MTAVYTHTRPETVRDQLVDAMKARPALGASQSVDEVHPVLFDGGMSPQDLIAHS